MDDFLAYWFRGFSYGLQQLDDHAMNLLLKECGKACSQSYSERIYKDTFQEAKNLDDFLQRLQTKFPEMAIKRHNANSISVMYQFCACDLVKNHFVSAPAFCNCSRLSLQNNWEAVLGKGNVTIKMLFSILAGNKQCEFLVSLNQ